MKCFIDVDGVVANFVEGCCQLYGMSADSWPKGEYSFPYAMLGEPSEDAVWDMISNQGASFWRGLPLMPDANEIVKHCELVFGSDNCAFLTSPPKSSPWAATGKLQWVKRHFPKYNRRVLIGACKEFCAHKDAVLVDDYAVNVDKFNAHGGHGILLPRWWNAEHELDTVQTLVERITNVIEGGAV